MVETRPWKFPDHRNGTTINFFADTQSGFRPQFADNWITRMAEDAAELSQFVDGHVHGGDCIEWNGVKPEDDSYKAFRKRVLADGLPYLDVPGNHDLCTYAASTTRSANEWAQQVPGRTQSNMVARMGGMAVIGLAPDRWLRLPDNSDYAPPDPLSVTTLSWLAATLDSLGDIPTWIVTHALPWGQAGTSTTVPPAEFTQPWDQIGQTLREHGNPIGWLSGHWHIGVDNTVGANLIDVGGGRRIFGINAPAASGIRGGWTAAQQQWQSNARSMMVTYLGDAVELRWRNHTNQGWLAGIDGDEVYSLTLTA